MKGIFRRVDCFLTDSTANHHQKSFNKWRIRRLDGFLGNRPYTAIEVWLYILYAEGCCALKGGCVGNDVLGGMYRHSRLSGSHDMEVWAGQAATGLRSTYRENVLGPLAQLRNELFKTFRCTADALSSRHQMLQLHMAAHTCTYLHILIPSGFLYYEARGFE